MFGFGSAAPKRKRTEEEIEKDIKDVDKQIEAEKKAIQGTKGSMR